MLVESSVLTIQTVAHFSIKFHPHQCVTLVPDEQERGGDGVLDTQGHADIQNHRYCKLLFKLSCPRYRAGPAEEQVTKFFVPIPQSFKTSEAKIYTLTYLITLSDTYLK